MFKKREKNWWKKICWKTKQNLMKRRRTQADDETDQKAIDQKTEENDYCNGSKLIEQVVLKMKLI